MHRDFASSPVIAATLIVAITIILAVLVHLIFKMLSLDYSFTPVPAIFAFAFIENTDEITKNG
jgi:FlaG/FlaF family flagellin (archaellin)